MALLNINESELLEKFVTGSGSGGQKLHKTAMCVYLKHIPTGLDVKCQETRQRESNRYFARKRLCEKIEFSLNKEQSEKQKAIEKIRRSKKKRTRRAKQKILDAKLHQAKRKSMRRKPAID